MIKYLIVGLGNIGPEYHETRHNIGFMTVEALARINNAPPFIDGRYGFTTSFSIKGRQLILLKPSTFMNLSGLAVRYWMQKENIPLENVLIVVDDLALLRCEIVNCTYSYFLLNWFMVISIPARQKLLMISPAVSSLSSIVLRSSSVKCPST